MYKQIYLDNMSTQYYINEYGVLKNEKTGHIYKGRINGGYVYYDLRFNNKKYIKRANRLVAEYFLNEIPENFDDLVVNHKDGNKLNNSYQNLEIISYSENNNHALQTGLKTSGNNRISRIKNTGDLENEAWRQYKNTNFYLSSLGRAKNIKTGNILKGKITANGYLEYNFSIDGVKRSFLAHRLIYSVFHDESLDKKDFINHIDGNKLNNQLSNLEKVDCAENVMKAYYETKVNPNIKTVYQYDLSGKLIGEYASYAEAARMNAGCRANLICNVCNGKKNTHHGYIWSYIKVEGSTTIP